MKRNIYGLIFLFSFIALSFLYNYHRSVFFRPQSIHKWRQSDCASLALNYYQGGMHFFYPETHNLTSDGGTTGYAATSEIPFLYYMVAILYQLFGFHEPLFRMLNLLLFFLGLFYLFRFYTLWLQDRFWAFVVALFFFTSPVLVFYGNSFLSNTGALSFSIIGWYYFSRYYRDREIQWFYLAILFFFLGGAFKVTALFSLFALGGVFLAEFAGLIKFDKKILIKPLQQAVISIFAVLLIFGWILYASTYNTKHDCTYFSTTVFPIWKMDKASILSVVDKVKNLWLTHYFSYAAFLFLSISAAILFALNRRSSRFLNWILLFLMLEAMLYLSLQFWTFADHDYYVIDLYILPVILLAGALYAFKLSFPRLFAAIWLKLVFVLFLAYNVYHAQKITHIRYTDFNNLSEIKDSYTATLHLRKLGISKNDTVISLPDQSNVSLYLMNQKGWTAYTDARFNRGEPIRYNQDSIGIQRSINRGAKYLILQGIGQLYQKSYLQNFCTNLVGTHNDLLIFDLNNENNNFHLKNRVISEIYFCDAENRVGNSFVSLPDSIQFKNGETRSNEAAFNDSFSSKLNSGHPFGMTLRIPDMKFGESFEITVWRKETGTAQGDLIASGDNFYFKKYEVVETRENGWEKIRMEFFVVTDLAGKEIGLYLYNPNQDPVYFDDFKIIKYKSVFNEI